MTRDKVESLATFINLETGAITKLDMVNEIVKDYNYREVIEAPKEYSCAVTDIRPVYFCPIMNRRFDTACYYVLRILAIDRVNIDSREEMHCHRIPAQPCRGFLCVMDASLSYIVMVANGEVDPDNCVSYYIDHINQRIEWMDNDLIYHTLAAMISPASQLLPVQHFIDRYRLINGKGESDGWCY